MAAAARRLLTDPSLAERLSSRAIEECRRKYAPDAVLREWQSLYEGVVTYSDAPAAEHTARPGPLR